MSKSYCTIRQIVTSLSFGIEWSIICRSEVTKSSVIGNDAQSHWALISRSKMEVSYA